MTLVERFEKHVNRIGHPGLCHVWTGSCDSKGYGRIGVAGINRIASRVAWELYRGTIPDGLFVLHHCDNPACVNTEHLYLGTPSDNNRDCMERGRHRVGPVALGEQFPHTKLTATKVREMRALRSSGLSLKQLATKYGVIPQTVSMVCLRRNWRHVK